MQRGVPHSHGMAKQSGSGPQLLGRALPPRGAFSALGLRAAELRILRCLDSGCGFVLFVLLFSSPPLFKTTELRRKKSLGWLLFANRHWRLRKDPDFAFAVYPRSGCQSLQGLELPVALEGRRYKVRQRKQLARFHCGSRNEEVKRQIFPEVKAESLL